MKTKICKKCGRELPIEEFYKVKACKDGHMNICKECFKQQQKQYQQEHKEEIAEYQKQYRQDNKEFFKQYYQYNKDAIAGRQKQYYQDNREAILEYQKQYRQDNKEEIAEYQKQYQQEHKEEIAEYQKQYYQDNKETILEQQKQYQQEHKEEIAEQKKQYYQDNKDAIAEQRKQYYQTPMGRAKILLSTYNYNDKKYNRGECTLTAQWIIDNIFSGQKCIFCGETDWHELGCDRIDNSKPHTPDNVNPCCEECNKKRGRKDFEEFLLTI